MSNIDRDIDRLDDLLLKIGTSTGGSYAELIDVSADLVGAHRKNATPQIIRTVAELEALDPDTLLSTVSESDRGGLARSAGHILACYGTQLRNNPDQWPFPAVVVAEGADLRARREALGEEAGQEDDT